MKLKTTALASLLLLAGGAAAAGPTPPPAPPAHGVQRDAPASGRSAQPKQWSDALRSSVRHQCEAAGPDATFCACLARRLETLSPDPSTEFTQQDIDAGLAGCQQERVEQVGEL